MSGFSAALGFVRRVVRALTPLEKVVVVIAFAIALSSVPFSIKARAGLGTSQPQSGGTFTEGILVKTSADLKDHAHRLEYRGLVSIDPTGKIGPDLAQSVELQKDRTRYVFRFVDNQPLHELRDVMIGLDPYKDAKILVTDQNTILVEFGHANPLFLDQAATAHIPFGPYKETTGEGPTITLERNPNFQPAPYFSRIVLVSYQSEDKLLAALRQKTVMAAWGIKTPINEGDIQTIQIPSALQVVLFFNTTRDGLKKPDERRTLAEGATASRTFKVLAKDSSNVAQALNDWQQMLARHNSTLEITTVPMEDLASTFGKTPNYDVVAIVADRSTDGSERALWHSSQLAPLGQNYAKWFDPAVDNAIAELERATTDADRLKARQKIEDGLVKGIPARITPVSSSLYAISAQVKGVHFSPLHSPTDRFAHIEGWYLKEKRVP